MKETVAILLAFLIVGMVIASGCMGGGTTTSSSSLTTSAGALSTSTPSETSSSSPSPSTTSTSVQTTTTTQEQTTTTTSSMETTTTTSIPTEEAYWAHPWEYAPIEVNGERYIITYYKYEYKIQPNQSAPVYEYIVEKSVEKITIHVYGQDFSGNKVDVGEHDVYAYTTVVTPVKGAVMDDKITFTLWFVSNESEAFLYPWHVLWAQRYLSPTVQDKNFVGMKFEYKGSTFVFMNPAPFKSGLFPYFEGDSKPFEEIDKDLSYLYMGWMVTLHFGIWHEWEDVNVLIPQSGVWSDMQGHSWKWSTNPDGTATFSGVTFKLVDFQWKYQGTPEGVSMDGKGKFSPYLSLLIEGDGHYSYSDPQTEKNTVIYAYLKLKDLKLERGGS